MPYNKHVICDFISIYILLYIYITSTKYLFTIYYVSILCILTTKDGAEIVLPGWEQQTPTPGVTDSHTGSF